MAKDQANLSQPQDPDYVCSSTRDTRWAASILRLYERQTLKP